MGRVLCGLAIVMAASATVWGAPGMEVRSRAFSARISGGSVVELKAGDGTSYVRVPEEPLGATIQRDETRHQVGASETPAVLEVGQTLTHTQTGSEQLAGARVDGQYTVDKDTGDLVIRQRAVAAEKGIWGVGCWVADIPLDYAILVPGCSGLRLTRDTPGPTYQYDYPMTWEAQLVIVEGPRGGFYAWAEDPDGRYKRLVVERHAKGWRIGLITINDAPFDSLTSCESVTWRLNTYEGDWRVPARRYRDWWAASSRPVAIADQQPAWVRDTRGCLVMGLDMQILESLPKQFDPPQTLLYVYDWREAGYDRDYPDYARTREQLMPFIERAHELGFRIMLHVNHFGVDPLHPAYQRFERYQVRSPWGTHDKEWWVWPLADPDIRFAYINPASGEWRNFFTEAMVELCRHTQADALHLDQTLCIYNDHNGRIDGLSMLQGSIQLHRQLREALPQVALSGEGLNEVTCRYEAFAQRHVWGLDHAQGTFDWSWLEAAHPISSYILRPFTIMYGYLGCAHPENDQLYAAWQEAYRHWGVIPTLKPTLLNLSGTDGFARQFFDELHFWQRERVDIDLEGSWSESVAFPWHTADGRRVVATQDRRLMCGDEAILRTVRGVNQLERAGMIPGWRAYDVDRLMGLCPDRSYPVFPGTGPADELHICKMPDDIAIDYVAVSNQLAIFALEDAQPRVADLTAMLERALVGSRPADGTVQQQEGPGMLPDGSQFVSSGGLIHAHPPWKNGAKGEAFAQFTCALPDAVAVRFATEVYLDASAVGLEKSDGVTFAVRASDGAQQISGRLHQATAEPQQLALDLSDFRGKTITLELAVAPGPHGSPTYDWARWRQPRIEKGVAGSHTITVRTDEPWELALAAAGEVTPQRTDGKLSIPVDVPGAAVLLRKCPASVTLPMDLTKTPDQVFFVQDSGMVVEESLYANAAPGTVQVSGSQRRALLVHPPNNGRTMAVYLLTLPTDPARLLTRVGLREGSKSEGVEVSVAANGRTCESQRIQPGTWKDLSVDLQPWAGRPLALSLVTDSAGSYSHDWGVWIEPRIVER